MRKALRVTHRPSGKMIYLLIISTLCCFPSITQAQEDTDWWFDVEILIFKHNNAENTVLPRIPPPFSARPTRGVGGWGTGEELGGAVIRKMRFEEQVQYCANCIDQGSSAGETRRQVLLVEFHGILVFSN